jgi:hypothetical protein
LADRFEVLQDKLGLWFVVEENDHGWFVGFGNGTKRQALRRGQVLTRDFKLTEIRVIEIGNGFTAIANGRGLGMVHATEAACRKAHNLMDFSQMAAYAPQERNRTRFERMLGDDVV